ncbi:hypothetical protein, partial [Pseudomonas aeruginosa]|uniref:hypothetical protein n=1 Tax=Pseudomonas aeruginosa TaxID=287 RepID=UPI001C44B67B
DFLAAYTAVNLRAQRRQVHQVFLAAYTAVNFRASRRSTAIPFLSCLYGSELPGKSPFDGDPFS